VRNSGCISPGRAYVALPVLVEPFESNIAQILQSVQFLQFLSKATGSSAYQISDCANCGFILALPTFAYGACQAAASVPNPRTARFACVKEWIQRVGGLVFNLFVKNAIGVEFLEDCSRWSWWLHYLDANLEMTPALTCLWIGVCTRVPGARLRFVFALLGIALSERLIRNAVRPHFVFPKHSGFGTRGLAAEPICCAARRAEFDAGRRGDEVYLPASIAHDTHMDGHASDYGTTEH
jgi:hypothetical protein